MPEQAVNWTAAAIRELVAAVDAPRVAVLLPCYNEEATVADVIADFRAALPDADIYVYDNASTDATSELATSAGAIVRREPLRGKGNVIRRMFADIDADIYVMADSDGTYDAAAAPKLVERLIGDNLDMVVGTRAGGGAAAYRWGHVFGNRMFNKVVAMLFGDGLHDILSGYRVFSRRFVKSFPALSAGFETETELSVHALDLRLPVAEIETAYGARPSGSESKLRTVRDGISILSTIMLLFKEVHPFWFFGAVSALFAALSLGLAYPIFVDYLLTGEVPRFPTAILATGIMLLACLGFACGLILDSVCRGRREAKRMCYLALASVGAKLPQDERIRPQG